MSEQQNNASLENRIDIMNQADGRRWLIIVQELDATESKISNGGEGDNYTEHSTYWVDGNKRGKTDIVDDQGRLHTITPFTVYTPIKATRKPVQSKRLKAVSKMTKKEKDAYIAELEANQK